MGRAIGSLAQADFSNWPSGCCDHSSATMYNLYGAKVESQDLLYWLLTPPALPLFGICVYVCAYSYMQMPDRRQCQLSVLSSILFERGSLCCFSTVHNRLPVSFHGFFCLCISIGVLGLYTVTVLFFSVGSRDSNSDCHACPTAFFFFFTHWAMSPALSCH